MRANRLSAAPFLISLYTAVWKKSSGGMNHMPTGKPTGGAGPFWPCFPFAFGGFYDRKRYFGQRPGADV
nr:MAG TPA: hypothetical protein [Caudoviricetes sp.]